MICHDSSLNDGEVRDWLLRPQDFNIVAAASLNASRGGMIDAKEPIFSRLRQEVVALEVGTAREDGDDVR
jgi:hypothetical protein